MILSYIQCYEPLLENTLKKLWIKISNSTVCSFFLSCHLRFALVNPRLNSSLSLCLSLQPYRTTTVLTSPDWTDPSDLRRVWNTQHQSAQCHLPVQVRHINMSGVLTVGEFCRSDGEWLWTGRRVVKVFQVKPFDSCLDNPKCFTNPVLAIKLQHLINLNCYCWQIFST